MRSRRFFRQGCIIAGFFAGMTFGFVANADTSSATVSNAVSVPPGGLSGTPSSVTDYTSDPIARAHPYSQMFSIQVGPFSPKAASISNSSNDFIYSGDALNSYQIEAGWGLRFFRIHGSSFSIQEGLSFAPLSGTTLASQTPSGNVDNINLYLFGLDSRLRYSAEWFPWRALIPFVEGGFRYTFYAQSGASDSESAQGGVGNAVAGAGLNFWLNPPSTDDVTNFVHYTSIPFFITASAQRIFPRSLALDLGDMTFTAGLSLGL